MDPNVHAIINSGAGSMTDDVRSELMRVVEDCFPGARFEFASQGADIARLSRKAVEQGSRLIIAGGGDGTISSVASVLAGTVSVMGVLPLGTLNHFAKDLGLPLDLEAAVRTVKTGRVRAVDVAQVNGRIFINNSSLGLYPEMVGVRREQHGRGRPKWLASLSGLAGSLAHYNLLRVRVVVRGKQLVRTTPLLFVGNNAYVMEGLNAGSRTSLDSGQLNLVIPYHEKRLGLILFSLMALLGYEPREHGSDIIFTDELWIDSRHSRLQVSLDGEVVELAPPLHYRILPGSLHVVVPASATR